MYSQHQGLCFVSLLILSKLAVSFEVDKLSWQTCVCVSPDPYVRVCVSASVCVCVCVRACVCVCACVRVCVYVCISSFSYLTCTLGRHKR